jgi:tetratricopeptide (TPR) repeat protein
VDFHVLDPKKAIYKLHGCVSDSDSLQYTIKTVGKGLSEKKKQVFEYYMKKYPFIFIGFSDNDYDITKCILETKPKTLWLYHKNISDQIQRLLNKINGEKAPVDQNMVLEYIKRKNYNIDFERTSIKEEYNIDKAWPGFIFRNQILKLMGNILNDAGLPFIAEDIFPIVNAFVEESESLDDAIFAIERGKICITEGDLYNAEKYLIQALNYFRKRDDERYLSTAYLLLFVYTISNIDYNRKGLKQLFENIIRSKCNKVDYRVSLIVGIFLFFCGDKKAENFLIQSINETRNYGDINQQAWAIYWYGNFLYLKNKYTKATEQFEEALYLSSMTGNMLLSAKICFNYGMCLFNRKMIKESMMTLLKSFLLYRQIGNTQGQLELIQIVQMLNIKPTGKKLKLLSVIKTMYGYDLNPPDGTMAEILSPRVSSKKMQKLDAVDYKSIDDFIKCVWEYEI